MKKGDMIYIVGLDSWNKTIPMSIPITGVGTKYIKARVPNGMELVFELQEMHFRGSSLMCHRQVGPYKQWAAFEDQLLYEEWKERSYLEARVQKCARDLAYPTTLEQLSKEQLQDIADWIEKAVEAKKG